MAARKSVGDPSSRPKAAQAVSRAAVAAPGQGSDSGASSQWLAGLETVPQAQAADGVALGRHARARAPDAAKPSSHGNHK